MAPGFLLFWFAVTALERPGGGLLFHFAATSTTRAAMATMRRRSLAPASLASSPLTSRMCAAIYRLAFPRSALAATPSLALAATTIIS
jgi:hypothetical protein